MHSTPKTIKAYDKAFKIRRDFADAEAYKDGEYFFEAMQTAISNVFRSKGHKPKSYLEVSDKPILQRTKEKEMSEDMTEEEKRKYTEAFFTNLEIQMANYNLAHPKEDLDNG